MTDVRTVTDAFAVAPQISPDELSALAGRFALLINNRPDGEAPDQPSSAQMEAAARAAGLRYAYVPVSGAPGPAEVEATRRLLADAPGPVLAFCRSGTRSILAWSLAQAADGRPAAEVEALVAAARYQVGPAPRALTP